MQEIIKKIECFKDFVLKSSLLSERFKDGYIEACKDFLSKLKAYQKEQEEKNNDLYNKGYKQGYENAASDFLEKE